MSFRGVNLNTACIFTPSFVPLSVKAWFRCSPEIIRKGTPSCILVAPLFSAELPHDYDSEEITPSEAERIPSMNSENCATMTHQARRRLCEEGCERPINVCLCDAIPKIPIPTFTKIVILQHPHEQRHKLATVPVLKKCLENCEIIVGRKLRYGDSGVLDSLHDIAVQNPNLFSRAIYLFPGKDALPLMEETQQRKSSDDDIGIRYHVLIVFDGTWKHAKEMLHASLLFLSKFANQACLEYDDRIDGGTIFESDLTLRKEPFSGCMSTMEAVARCLQLLEPNGIEIESRLIGVLSTMVKFQASHLKPTKPRPKFHKKSKADVG